MSQSLPDTASLQTFVAVVEAGSIAAAARELGLPRATVSRRLSRLEEDLEVRLIRRTTRRLSVTEAGEALYPRARAVLTAAAQARDAVVSADGPPRGLLRVSMPPVQGSDLPDLLGSFARAFPEVELVVDVGTAHVDLVAGDADLALRAGPQLDDDLIARPLARTDMHVVGHPAYLADRGVPLTPDDLADHACLRGFARGLRPATHWPLRDGGQVRVEGPFASNDLTLLLAAARDGRGLALLPDLYTAHDVATGTLEPVLPDTVGATSAIALVYPERALVPAAVRAFVDHARAWFHARGGAGGLAPSPPTGTP